MEIAVKAAKGQICEIDIDACSYCVVLWLT